MAGPWEKFGGAVPAPSTPPDTTPQAPWEKFKQQEGSAPQTQAASDHYADLPPAQREAAIWLDQHPEAQHGFANNLAGKFTQGASMGWFDEALAGLGAGRDYLRGKGNFGDLYDKHYGMQQEQLRRATENTGGWGTATEVLGGIGTGLGAGGLVSKGLGKIGLGITPGQSLGARVLAGGAEGAGYGAVSGAGAAAPGEGTDGAVRGALTGGVIGGVAPVAVEVVKNWTPLGSLGSTIMGVADPRGTAERKVAETLRNSGKSADEITNSITNAKNLGQEDFVLADAMGKEGQRLLTGVAKQPGAARPAINDFLNARQMNSADRVSNFIDDSFGTSATGKQAAAALRQEAQTNAAPLYKAANEFPIQMTPETKAFLSDPIAQSALERGLKIQRLEDLAANPGTHNPANFSGANFKSIGSSPASGDMRTLDAVKRGIDDLLEGYRDPTTGRLNLNGEGRAIDTYRRAFLDHLDSINPNYSAARQAYAGPAAEAGAIPFGRRAATTGRAADNIDTFNKLSPTEQLGFRTGYADSLQGQLERARPGADQAARFTPNKIQQEIDRFATSPDAASRFKNQVQNEQLMHSTRNQALGGSSTAENLADMANTEAAVNMASKAATGSWGSLALDVVKYIGGHGKDTEAVRRHIADILLSGRGNINDLPLGVRPALQKMGVIGPGARPENIDAFMQILEDKNLFRDKLSAGAHRAFNSGIVAPAIRGSVEYDTRSRQRSPYEPVPVSPTVSRAGNGYVQTRPASPAPVVVNRNGRR